MAELIQIKHVRVGVKNLVAKVELAEDAPLSTADDLQATARVYRLLPHIIEHSCMGDGGETFKEVMGNTSLTHLLEHVCVELLSQTDVAGDINSGRTFVSADSPREATIELSCQDDVLCVSALSTAIWILNWAFKDPEGQTPDIDAIVSGLVGMLDSIGTEPAQNYVDTLYQEVVDEFYAQQEQARDAAPLAESPSEEEPGEEGPELVEEQVEEAEAEPEPEEALPQEEPEPQLPALDLDKISPEALQAAVEVSETQLELAEELIEEPEPEESEVASVQEADPYAYSLPWNDIPLADFEEIHDEPVAEPEQELELEAEEEPQPEEALSLEADLEVTEELTSSVEATEFESESVEEQVSGEPEVEPEPESEPELVDEDQADEPDEESAELEPAEEEELSSPFEDIVVEDETEPYIPEPRRVR